MRPQHPQAISVNASAAIVAGIYALVAALWIALSDSALATLVSNTEQLVQLQMLKGWLFVGITAVLLFFLMRWRLTQLASSQQTVLEDEGRLQSILSSIDDLVFVIDPDGTLIDCAQPNAPTLLLPMEQFLGRRLDSVGLPADVAAKMLDAIEQLRRKPEVVSIDYALDLPQGRHWFESRLSRLLDGEGAFAGVTAVARDVSARHRAEDKLRDSELSFRTLLEGLPNIAVQGYDRERRIIFWNPASERLYGFRRDEVLGRKLEDTIIPPELRTVLVDQHQRWLDEGVPIPAGEIALCRSDGSLVPVYSSHALIVNSRDEPEMFCLDVDMGKLRQAESELRLAARVFESSAEGIIITDCERLVLAANDAFSRITGFARDEILGKTPDFLASGLQSKDYVADIWREAVRTGHWQGEISNRRRSGEVFPGWLAITAVHDDAGQPTHFIAILADLSERKAIEARLQHLTHHDPLTNLPNRLLLRDRVEQALAFASRERRRLALLLLDLDHFKEINDSLGHAIGDRLLIAIAARLGSCVRDTDTISRQGGDEFLIALSSVKDSAAVASIAANILQAMEAPFTIDDQTLACSFSIGIAVWPEDGEDFDTLLLKTDTAMYKAKESGRNAYRFFNEHMNTDGRRRLQLQSGLRLAIERDELSVHYQPQINLGSGAITGAEALLRWTSREFGEIGPNIFIPLAEQSGLIHAIGEWVLLAACRQAELWRRHYPPGLTVAVNLSAQQFRRGDPVALIKRALAASGLPGELLELEITESMLISEADEVLGMLQRLKALGVRLAIDDFGTGYSSLSYLQRFPIDKLKIDQSFVRHIARNNDDAAIVDTIVQLGRILKLTTIAEGVEELQHASFLRAAGCNEAQGYLFGKPMPAAQFAELLARGDATTAADDSPSQSS
ncbi:EAL and GGDEF domain-containing protein [Rhodocyclus tenuis]|uniref:sensor domain-containing protein n=1 Tax=Rhodocyclus tenuis TaxID=1066 RepID=UPI00190895EB|nr:bifunctional diguanylate cyclase/phosphodiesterase [Rhodocyclus tenuis]MBK1679732.1 hypothetical protein [Rhodocyclus tenuis]